MPFALVLIGLILLVAGVRKQQSELFRLLRSDFTGQGNFVYWVLAIMAVGALGYVPKLKPISHALLVLLVVVIFLSSKGFFADLTRSINSTTKNPAPEGLGANAAKALGYENPFSALQTFGSDIPHGPIGLANQ